MSDSVFSLPSADVPLPPVSDSLQTSWVQHSTKGASSGENFYGAPAVFEWQASGNTWWKPSESYIRIRGSIKAADGSDVSLADGIAPAMGMAGAMFQNQGHEINNMLVSKIDNHVGLVDAAHARTSQSKSMLDSLSKANNFMDPWFEQRQCDVAEDAFQRLPGAPIATDFVGRVGLGFDAAGAAGASNSIAYALPAGGAGYGIATFAQDGGAVLPADVRVIFPPGSTLQIEGESPMRVVGGGSTTTLNVVPIDPDQAAVAAFNGEFSRALSDSAVVAGRRAGSFELVYRPSLGIWNTKYAIPGSRHRLTLQPHSKSQLQASVIESLTAKTAGTSAGTGDYYVEIDDIYLYACMINGDLPQDGEFNLDLVDLSVQTTTDVQANNGQKDFTVPRTTFQTAIAYNDTRSSNSTQYPSTRFVTGAPGAHTELALSDLQITYADQVQPRQRAYPAVQGNKDWGTQQYYNTQLVIGGSMDEGGAESIRDFRERGTFYAFTWDKPRGKYSTDVQVNASFDEAYPGFSVNNMRLLLFVWSSTVAKLTIAGGEVKAVNTFQK